MRIELLKSGSLYSTIGNQVRIGFRGRGTRYRRVPRDLLPGNDYEIRITSTTNNSYTDTSDSFFYHHYPVIWQLRYSSFLPFRKRDVSAVKNAAFLAKKYRILLIYFSGVPS